MCTGCVCVYLYARLGTMDDGGNRSSNNSSNSNSNSSGSMIHILYLRAPSAKMMMIFMVCIWKHNLLTVSYLMQINYNKLNTGNRFCWQNKTKICIVQKADLVWGIYVWKRFYYQKLWSNHFRQECKRAKGATYGCLLFH